MTIPELKTERLVLAPPVLDDFEAIARLWSLPDVYRFIGGEPRPRDICWTKFQSNIGTWSLFGYGMWSLREAGSGGLAGQLGFVSALRELGDDFDGFPEVGWTLDPACFGQGYALEAMQAVLAWFDKERPGSKTVCVIDLDNAASIRLAKKLGYTLLRHTEYNEAEVALFQRRV